MEPQAEGGPAPREPERPTDLPFSKRMRIEWSGVEAVPISMANQFLAQIDSLSDGAPDQIVLSLGQLVAPPVLGTEGEKEAQVAALDSVSVNILARYSLTPARVSELLGLLQVIKEHLDQAGTASPLEVRS